MFLFVGLISGPGSVSASLAECSMSRVKLQVESSRKTGVLVYKISWEKLSVTSRRGPPTSRRQNSISMSRRDVYFHVVTSFFDPLCHVATCIFTSQRHY